MVRTGKCGSARCVYLPPEWAEYMKLCRAILGISGSERLSQLLLEDLAELQGRNGKSNIKSDGEDVGKLQREYTRLFERGRRIQKLLGDKVLASLCQKAHQWGLDFDEFKNFEEITAKFLSYTPNELDHFTSDDIELIIQVMQLGREKSMKKSALDKARLEKLASLKLSADSPAKSSTERAL